MEEHDHDDVLEPLRSTVATRAIELDARSSALRGMVAQLVLDTTNEGIWLINAQARTTFVNHALAELLGYTEQEMIGKHIFDFIEEERQPLAQRNLMRRQRGAEDREEVRLRRKDGTFVWAIGSANPVYDRHGHYAGALALLGDLTTQKETEAYLRARVQDLSTKLVEKAESDRPGRPVGAYDELPARLSLVRESLRAATVLVAGGTFVSIVGLLTLGGVVSAFLSSESTRAEARDGY